MLKMFLARGNVDDSCDYPLVVEVHEKDIMMVVEDTFDVNIAPNSKLLDSVNRAWGQDLTAAGGQGVVRTGMHTVYFSNADIVSQLQVAGACWQNPDLEGFAVYHIQKLGNI